MAVLLSSVTTFDSHGMACPLGKQPDVELALLSWIKRRWHNDIAARVQSELAKDTPAVGIGDGGSLLLNDVHPIFPVLFHLLVQIRSVFG